MQCLCPVITASANAPAKLNAACVWSRLANGQISSNNRAGGEYRAQYATLIQLLSDYANTNAKTKTNAIMVQPTIKKHYAYGELVFSKMGNLSSQGWGDGLVHTYTNGEANSTGAPKEPTEAEVEAATFV